MPVVTSSNSLKPESIESCKRTYVVAKGKAEFADPRGTAAVKGAKDAAKAELANAVAAALTLRCPTYGGCANLCEQGRTVRVGKGLDWKVAEKKRDGLYHSTAWAYEAFDVECRCPRG
jgi:hypothetical protein